MVFDREELYLLLEVIDLSVLRGLVELHFLFQITNVLLLARTGIPLIVTHSGKVLSLEDEGQNFPALAQLKLDKAITLLFTLIRGILVVLRKRPFSWVWLRFAD